MKIFIYLSLVLMLVGCSKDYCETPIPLFIQDGYYVVTAEYITYDRTTIPPKVIGAVNINNQIIYGYIIDIPYRSSYSIKNDEMWVNNGLNFIVAGQHIYYMSNRDMYSFHITYTDRGFILRRSVTINYGGTINIDSAEIIEFILL